MKQNKVKVAKENATKVQRFLTKEEKAKVNRNRKNELGWTNHTTPY